jgi:predicted transcriptional regulator
MKIKLNTEKNGQNAVWKLHEIASIEELILHEDMTSGEVWSEVRSKGVEISRASVILFLNRLVESGLANYRSRSGKGGVHKVYALVDRTWADFNSSVIDKFLYKLWEIFPENDRIKSVISA